VWVQKGGSEAPGFEPMGPSGVDLRRKGFRKGVAKLDKLLQKKTVTKRQTTLGLMMETITRLTTIVSQKKQPEGATHCENSEVLEKKDYIESGKNGGHQQNKKGFTERGGRGSDGKKTVKNRWVRQKEKTKKRADVVGC